MSTITGLSNLLGQIADSRANSGGGAGKSYLEVANSLTDLKNKEHGQNVMGDYDMITVRSNFARNRIVDFGDYRAAFDEYGVAKVPLHVRAAVESTQRAYPGRFQIDAEADSAQGTPEAIVAPAAAPVAAPVAAPQKDYTPLEKELMASIIEADEADEEPEEAPEPKKAPESEAKKKAIKPEAKPEVAKPKRKTRRAKKD